MAWASLSIQTGRLGTGDFFAPLQRRDQTDGRTSEAILALHRLPSVTRRRLIRQGIRTSGLVAEDVEKVNPDLIVRDKEGKPYSCAIRSSERNVAQRVPQGACKVFVEEQRKVQE